MDSQRPPQKWEREKGKEMERGGHSFRVYRACNLAKLSPNFLLKNRLFSKKKNLLEQISGFQWKQNKIRKFWGMSRARKQARESPPSHGWSPRGLRNPLKCREASNGPKAERRWNVVVKRHRFELHVNCNFMIRSPTPITLKLISHPPFWNPCPNDSIWYACSPIN